MPRRDACSGESTLLSGSSLTGTEAKEQISPFLIHPRHSGFVSSHFLRLNLQQRHPVVVLGAVRRFRGTVRGEDAAAISSCFASCSKYPVIVAIKTDRGAGQNSERRSKVKVLQNISRFRCQYTRAYPHGKHCHKACYGRHKQPRRLVLTQYGIKRIGLPAGQGFQIHVLLLCHELICSAIRIDALIYAYIRTIRRLCLIFDSLVERGSESKVGHNKKCSSSFLDR